MLKAIRGLLTVALSVGAFTSTMYAANIFTGSSSTVFVMTNDTVKNEVLAYQRLQDGSFALKGSFATGGRGSGGTTDPLQSQGSLTLSGDHNLLFAISTQAVALSPASISSAVCPSSSIKRPLAAPSPSRSLSTTAQSTSSMRAETE